MQEQSAPATATPAQPKASCSEPGFPAASTEVSLLVFTGLAHRLAGADDVDAGKTVQGIERGAC